MSLNAKLAALASKLIGNNSGKVLTLDANGDAQPMALPSYSRVSGLSGSVNSSTPLTKYDLSANSVIVQNSTGLTSIIPNPNTLTCDLGLTGPVANGRDQSAVFSANSWVYIYYIWNGTTLATLASTFAPNLFTGTTLPSGYTYWTLATILRWNASSNILPGFTRNSNFYYDVSSGGFNRLVSLYASTSYTALSCSSLIPPTAGYGKFNVFSSINSNSQILVDTYVRPTGSTSTMIAGTIRVQTSGATDGFFNWMEIPLGTSNSIDLALSTVTGIVSGGSTVDVMGYPIPNGG